MSAERVLIRADAAASIGNGHVMRCLSLADTLRSVGVEVRFACADLPGKRIDLIEQRGYPVCPLPTLKSPPPTDSDWLLVDHYALGRDWETANRQGRKLMVIDDLHRDHDADLLLDQNLGVSAAHYRSSYRSGASQDKRLIGPDYVLLDSRFLITRRDENASRLLISLGGTDPDNAVCAVLDALEPMVGRLAGDIVLAANAPHLDAVRARIAVSRHDWQLQIDVRDMAALMAKARVAVGAPGTSAWERCALGLPTCLIATADNQLGNAAGLGDAGAAYFLGQHPAWHGARLRDALGRLLEDDKAHAAMAARARQICDGLGRVRVAAALLDIRARDGLPVRLRWAERSDAERMFEWQSHPDTRRFARNPAAPRWPEHTAWLDAKLADPDCLFTLVMHGDSPAGVYRLDRREQGWEISILIAPDRYRLGLGRAALTLGRMLLPNDRLLAHVEPGNNASAALFDQAGFVHDGTHYVSDTDIR